MGVLEYLRRPIKIDDWNNMVEKINAMEEDIKQIKENMNRPSMKWEGLKYFRTVTYADEFINSEEAHSFSLPYVVEFKISSDSDLEEAIELYKLRKEEIEEFKSVLADGKGVIATIQLNQGAMPEKVKIKEEEKVDLNKNKKQNDSKRGKRKNKKP